MSNIVRRIESGYEGKNGQSYEPRTGTDQNSRGNSIFIDSKTLDSNGIRQSNVPDSLRRLDTEIITLVDRK